MRPVNALKERWDGGGSVIGVWMLIPSGITAEVVARAGFDFICVDNQHGVNDYGSTTQMLQVIALGSAVPLVRVPWNEPGVIGKMLDSGHRRADGELGCRGGSCRPRLSLST